MCKCKVCRGSNCKNFAKKMGFTDYYGGILHTKLPDIEREKVDLGPVYLLVVLFLILTLSGGLLG